MLHVTLQIKSCSNPNRLRRLEATVETWLWSSTGSMEPASPVESFDDLAYPRILRPPVCSALLDYKR